MKQLIILFYMNNIVLLQEYIKALIINVDVKNVPNEINVIFDGGAFNGGFALGIALYLKCMEQHKMLRIQSISGCSIGSILAVWYLTGCQSEGIVYFEQFMNYYKKNGNLYAYKDLVLTFIDSIFKGSDEAKILEGLQGKLFITYYNTKKHIQTTVSTFKTKEYLIECLIRSSHIPYLMDGHASYKNKYMDGVSPYIFKNDIPSLFIKLLTFNKCTRALIVRSENNIHYRLLTGVADVNEFFTTGYSDMCSYVGKWSYKDNLQLRLREIVCFFIFSLIGWFIVLKNYLPLQITNSLLYNGVLNAVNGLYNDLVWRMLI